MRMVPYVEKAKEKGPATSDAKVLRAWLESTAEGVVRVPITVRAGGLAGVRWDLAIGALDVTMSDSALGVSFEDRVRQACQSDRPCRVWVEGRWRGGVLHIIHFSRAIAADEVADFVEREK
jgi:hypothetical protein